MDTQHSALSTEIRRRNARLDRALRRRVGISVEAYKVIKAITQLLGVFAGVWVIQTQRSTDPMAVYTLMVVVITGPELLEVMLTNDGGGGE